MLRTNQLQNAPSHSLGQGVAQAASLSQEGFEERTKNAELRNMILSLQGLEKI